MGDKKSVENLIKGIQKYAKIKAPIWFFEYGLHAIFSRPDVSEDLLKKKSGTLEGIKSARLSQKQLMEILAEKLVILDELGSELLVVNYLPLLGLPKEIKDSVEETNKNAIKLSKSKHGKKAAAAKLAKDPRQSLKNEVHECWMAWQNNPKIYSSKAEFARDMIEKYGETVIEKGLKSHTTITVWCRKWERGT